MDIRETFPSKFLKASDLKGHEVIVTVDRVEFEPVGQGKEMKGVLYFQGKDKGMVLNKTNANKIVEITGSALTEEWKGQRIKLYPTETSFNGEMVDCVRVRPVGPKAMQMTKPAPDPTPTVDDSEFDADSIPFLWLVPFIMPTLAGVFYFC